MRVTILEGTPEEIAELQERVSFLAPPDSVSTRTPVSTLPEHVAGFMMSRGSPNYRAHVEQFVHGALGLGVIVEPGTSKVSEDGMGPYLLIYDSGPRMHGAAAAVHPKNGMVEFRLPHGAAQGRSMARPIRPKGGPHKYQVRTYLTSEEAVEESLELLKESLEIIRRGGT